MDDGNSMCKGSELRATGMTFNHHWEFTALHILILFLVCLPSENASLMRKRFLSVSFPAVSQEPGAVLAHSRHFIVEFIVLECGSISTYLGKEYEKRVETHAGARPLRPLGHGRDQTFILVE